MTKLETISPVEILREYDRELTTKMRAKLADELERIQKDLSDSDYELNKALTEYDRLNSELLKTISEQSRFVAAVAAALDWIESADHKFDCPRNRDDYDCTCRREEIIQQLDGAFEGAQ